MGLILLAVIVILALSALTLVSLEAVGYDAFTTPLWLNRVVVVLIFPCAILSVVGFWFFYKATGQHDAADGLWLDALFDMGYLWDSGR